MLSLKLARGGGSPKFWDRTIGGSETWKFLSSKYHLSCNCIKSNFIQKCDKSLIGQKRLAHKWPFTSPLASVILLVLYLTVVTAVILLIFRDSPPPGSCPWHQAPYFPLPWYPMHRHLYSAHLSVLPTSGHEPPLPAPSHRPAGIV